MTERLKWKAVPWIGAATCTVAAAFACPQVARSESDPATRSASEHADAWIEDLGSSSFATRKTATQQLTAAGTQAIRAVSTAVTNTDPEVAYRARAILTSIAESDAASVPVLLELEHTGPTRVAHVVGGILKIPDVQRRSSLFKQRIQDQSATQLRLARLDVMQRRTASAWRRVRQLQSLHQRFGLFAAPNPILAVIACLEVDSPDADVRAGRIQNRSEKVLALVQQARTDLTEGRLDEARRFATVAGRLGTALDRISIPRRFLAEIESTTLMRAARANVQAGRIDAAREELVRAETIDRKYGLFAQAVRPETRMLFVLFRARDPAGDMRALVAKPKELAASLLQLARADLDSQQLRAARRKADLARLLDVDERAKFFVRDIDDLLNNSVARRDVAQRLLEIALEFEHEGDRAQAENWLAHVVRVYPTTEAAMEASRLLKSLP